MSEPIILASSSGWYCRQLLKAVQIPVQFTTFIARPGATKKEIHDFAVGFRVLSTVANRRQKAVSGR